MFSKLGRRVAQIAALTMIAATVTLSGGPARADSGMALDARGGGCGQFSYGAVGNWRACVNSPGWGMGRSDGYVNLNAGHAACTVTVRVYRLGFATPAANGQPYTCPAGQVSGWHVYGPDFYAESGSYYSVLWVNGEGGYASPLLYMP